MIFHRALLREFAGLAGAVFMTLFAISLTTRLIRLLGQAAGGTIPSDAVFAFLGFFALGALPVLQARMGVSMSRTGHTEVAPNGDRFIVLEQGRRYEGSPGDDEYRVTEFDRYAARIESKDSSEPEMTPRNRSTWTLLANPSSQNLGELVWRVGVPLSALVLVLLAIPMSFVNPRAGRSANLLFALFTYIVYSNLLSVSRARVSQGRLDFGVGWWLVHAGMVLLLLFMFAQRMQLIRLRVGR